MAKETLMKDYMDETDDALDFFDGSDESMIDSMMENLMENHNQQTMMAIELTKVALSKNSEPNLSEEKIFEIFKRALLVITESSPLNHCVEKE